MSGGTGTAQVLVVVGTDHHPFDRVVSWTDDWLRGAGAAASAVVQYGSSAPPQVASGRPLLAHAELQELMRDSAVVVSHGGPATITEVRRAGRLPVVVPRDPALGEHVDGHQLLFSRRMGAAGLVVLCEAQAEFEAALGSALADPSAFGVDAGGDQERVHQSVRRVQTLVEDLVSSTGAGRPRWATARRAQVRGS